MEKMLRGIRGKRNKKKGEEKREEEKTFGKSKTTTRSPTRKREKETGIGEKKVRGLREKKKERRYNNKTCQVL